MSQPSALVPAWEHEPTRDAVRRYRRSGRLWLVAGMALFVAAVVIASRSQDRSEQLEQTGDRTVGVVVDVHRGNRLSEGSIDVRFEAHGAVHVKQINLNSDSPLYAIGDEVEVIYDPTNLSNIRTTEEENDSGWSVFAFVIGFVGGLLAMPVGWTIGRRARRWKRMFEQQPWRQVHSKYKQIPAGRSIQPLLQLREGAKTVVGGVTSSVRWRLRALQGHTELWMVGDLDGPAIVAPSQDGPLFEFRRSRRRRKQRKWEAAFGVDAVH